MKYIVEIEMERKHCLGCPLRDYESDGCRLQPDGYFETWEDQMEGCPLKEKEDQDAERNIDIVKNVGKIG